MPNTETAVADLRERVLIVCHTYQRGSHRFGSPACQASCSIVANEILKILADHDAVLAAAVREQCAEKIERVAKQYKEGGHTHRELAVNAVAKEIRAMLPLRL